MFYYFITKIKFYLQCTERWTYPDARISLSLESAANFSNSPSAPALTAMSFPPPLRFGPFSETFSFSHIHVLANVDKSPIRARSRTLALPAWQDPGDSVLYEVDMASKYL